ncbi:polysaccharide biosynthesis protein [Dyadobacter chenwenxiniae]|uniref:Polysaccharide biosynthesis protein n=1 Tax=Dyadobacter chenwenxiniae TaxID=2906456 RepID=A0A9X1TDL2_9BACT|nr:polysaccharide biosynthesis protein [Dyadobacter chenwenxiniae]MCF0051782.1 polysaccharide biosynthesis protein [Dyadobacter chenwenxiniae]MCF0060490.1 polysaccharide biosynthesis protein [Dyadobacter chenwenxiniae]UON86222.1 polysaccharide biosynthesis protein [Dyadobacter chenwenxiniae]
MKKLSEQMQTHAVYDKAVKWGKLVAITGGTQAAVQAMGLITGILIIRLLPMKEYAYYTIANTVLGTMMVLSDSGINNAIMSQGGPVWKDKQQLGTVLSTGLYLRRRFAVLSLCVSLPILLFFLIHQGAGWPTSLLIAAALVPAFTAGLSDSILEIPSRLHQDIKSLQVNQLLVGIGRFLLSILSLSIFPWTFISLLANGIPRIWGNVKLKQNAGRFADFSKPVDAVVNAEMLKMVKRIFPLTVYYAYSGQIVIWLVSLSGTAFAVAQIGALGRISMILNFFNVMFAIMIIPRFARLNADRNKLLRSFLMIMGGLLTFSVLIVLISWLFSPVILSVLGREYADLETALVLNMAGSSLAMISGAVYGIYSSRGWTIQPFFSIGINLVTVAAGIMLLDVSNLKGVLIFNIVVAFAQFLVNTAFCGFKILKTKHLASA